MITPIHDWLTLDEHGIQMPWYTRPCLEVIDKWDFQGKYIFEYGVGYSTLWYRSRGADVWGVDSNAQWADFAGKYCIPRVSYMMPRLDFTSSQNKYVTRISLLIITFDFVIIDGNFRDDCTEYALQYLKPGGKLILDNWLQPEVEEFWPKTEELIKGMPIEIYKEPDHPHWKTAIVTKP